MIRKSRLFRFAPSFVALEDRCVPATLVVNTNGDNATTLLGDATLALREAVNAVNTGTTVGMSAAELAQITGVLGIKDLIQFDPDIAGQTVVLAKGELPVQKSVQIRGVSNTGGITISGGGTNRLFNFNDGTAAKVAVTLTQLTLQGGHHDRQWRCNS